MKLYNSLTQKIETLDQKVVNIYACGPTVYNYIHLGNARPNILADILIRYLRSQNVTVNFCQNITDIDDKIIQQALKEKVSEEKIARFYTQAYLADLKNLNVQPPTKLIPISDHLPEMTHFISQLVDQKNAYSIAGDVYFALNNWQDEYGKLSGKKMSELLMGERIEVNQQKQNLADFALWKKTNEGKKWDSPFGLGRPGWHTECATLIDAYFDSQTIDLHLGGIDLKFPHHENERIQFLAKNQKEIAKIWLHNGHLNFQNEKMSKSVGNVVLVRDFLKKYPPNLLRWIFLTTHYKQPLNFTPDLMEQGMKFLEKVNNLKKKLIQARLFPTNNQEFTNLDLWTPFTQAMDNDLNTAEVLSTLEMGIGVLNQALGQKVNFLTLQPTFNEVVKIFAVLGFFPLLDLTISPVDEKLYHQWAEALKKQNYQLADELRQQLQKRGLI